MDPKLRQVQKNSGFANRVLTNNFRIRIRITLFSNIVERLFLSCFGTTDSYPPGACLSTSGISTGQLVSNQWERSEYANRIDSGRVCLFQSSKPNKMTFGESIKTCFSKYADFTGRASRSEYWWWFLFVLLATVATSIVSEKLSALFSLAVMLPGLAVGARRLHDIDKSGWFQLLYLIPVIGWIIVVYWAVQEGKEPNRF